MINWGIIGFGNMGKQYFNCLQKKSSVFNLTAVASQSKKGVNKLSKDIKFFNDYDDLIQSDLVDAIYISTLNNTHKILVEKAFKSNKKILCEKPLGMNLNEVKELHNLLKDNQNNFIEAIAYRSHPQTEILLNLIKETEMGQIKKIVSTFGFKLKKIRKDSRLFSKKLGGGSILDLGCYPVSFFNLFKKDKQMKVIRSKFNLCETDVDINGEIDLKIDDNILATGRVSLKENLDNSCKIFLENALITIKEPWLPSNKSFIEVETKSRYFKKIINSNKNVYDYQIELSSSFFSNRTNDLKNLVNINESLEIAKILETWKTNT